MCSAVQLSLAWRIMSAMVMLKRSSRGLLCGCGTTGGVNNRVVSELRHSGKIGRATAYVVDDIGQTSAVERAFLQVGDELRHSTPRH